MILPWAGTLVAPLPHADPLYISWWPWRTHLASEATGKAGLASCIIMVSRTGTYMALVLTVSLAWSYLSREEESGKALPGGCLTKASVIEAGVSRGV
jgi:hypothetical protein